MNPNFTKRHFTLFFNQYSVSGTTSDVCWSLSAPNPSVCLLSTVVSALSHCFVAGAFKEPINLCSDSVATGAHVELSVLSEP